MPPGQMYFISPSARCPRLVSGQVGGADLAEVRRFSACGLEADLPDRLACSVTAEAVAPGVVVEGCRDPHAEILMLRHQLSVALRERPRAHSRLTWPDRAWLALLARENESWGTAAFMASWPGSASR